MTTPRKPGIRQRPRKRILEGGPMLPYKSVFEERIARQLKDLKSGAVYEREKLSYTITKNYMPDWVLPNWVIIEAKGYFDSDDRKKLLAVKKAHPERIICIVFQKASNRITRWSKTTYGDWATKHGFPWSEGTVNPEWLEIPNMKEIVMSARRLRELEGE